MTEDDKTPNKLSMEVDPAAINAIIKQTVNAQIAVALEKNGLNFTDAVVDAVLTAKVDRDGKIIPKSHYSYRDSKTSWFDSELEKLIRECAKGAMIDFVETQRPKIEAAMLAAFKKRTPQIVKAMTDGTLKAFTSKWGFNFNVSLRPKDE